jgi:ADP-ribose pyrophosphatase YjhB (NUDIX family)
MPPVTFTDADTQAWYAGLATMYGAAAALITDPSGRVLLVKPNYRDHWSLPGGVLEHGEPPHLGCAREVAEEVGLKITVGPLLVVDWAPPNHERPRPVMFFVFDGGETSPDVDIRLQEEDLEDYRFTDPGEFGVYLPPVLEARYTAAEGARAAGGTVYLPSRAR